MNWKLVTDYSPDAGDLPVTVVRSRDRNHAVWTNLLPDETTDEIKRSVLAYFEHEERLTREDWYPPLC